MDEIQYAQTVAAEQEWQEGRQQMLRARIEYEVSEGLHDIEYSEYIIGNSAGDVLICNGDALIRVMESGRYFDGFCDFLQTKMQDRIAESARQNMQAARIEKDRQDILRKIGFYGTFKENK